MVIEVFDDASGIRESYSDSSLNFIKHSYPEYADKEMGEEEYKTLAIKLVEAKYKDSRFENANWKVEVK